MTHFKIILLLRVIPDPFLRVGRFWLHLYLQCSREICAQCVTDSCCHRSVLCFFHVDWLGGNIPLQNTVAVENEN